MITDLRINAKGELEGKVIPPAKWEEMYTKDEVVAMLTELQLEIEELRLDRPLFSRGYECYGCEDKTPTEIQQECSDIIQQKINELKGNAYTEDIDAVAFDAISLPDNATNGDVIKALFPNKQFVSICSDRIYDFTTNNKIDCDLDWWNAPYKENDNANAN